MHTVYSEQYREVGIYQDQAVGSVSVVESAPQTLLLHVDRNHYMTGEYINRAIGVEKHIELPLTTPTGEQRVPYKLCSVTCGGGVKGGHFWSYQRQSDNSWLYFNDSLVTRVSSEEVYSQASKTGTVFGYRKRTE